MQVDQKSSILLIHRKANLPAYNIEGLSVFAALCAILHASTNEDIITCHPSTFTFSSFTVRHQLLPLRPVVG